MVSFLDLEALKQGVYAIGLDLSIEQIDQLDRFSALLFKWNKTYNLTSIKGKEEVLTHHILDSLSVIPYFDRYLHDQARLLDVGSGGGLPAIPIAICRPNLQVELVETVGKKTAFLTQAYIELGLKNVRVHNTRVERLQSKKYDAISSRAFSSLLLFTNLSKHLLKDGGVWLAMKGHLLNEELSQLDDFVKLENVTEIGVPQLHEKRHLIVLSVME